MYITQGKCFISSVKSDYYLHNMAEQNPCIQCNIKVTGRSHAVVCDGCGRWNHRTCGTGITHQQYLQLRRGDITIAWRCAGCGAPSKDVERTRQAIPPPKELYVSPLRTMNASGRDVGEHTVPEVTTVPIENCLPDLPLTDDIPVKTPTTYEIVEAGTKRGAPKLVSSDGYTYTLGIKTGERRYWRCAVRNKTMVCPASVKEFLGMFTPGLGGHVHPADPGAEQKVKIAKRVKEVAIERKFESAAAIVEQIIKKMVAPNDANLLNPKNLTRAANLHRRLRPDDHADNASRMDEVEHAIPEGTLAVTEVQRTTKPQETSVPDLPLTDDIPDKTPTTYEIVEAGTKRGAPKLVSSDGYTYTLGIKTGERRYWSCAVRNKTMVCPASVKEFLGMFTPGLGGHVHPADPGAAQKVKIAKKVKEVAKERRFESAAAIVERIMAEMVAPNDVNLLNPDNLARAANHHRRLRLDDHANK